MTNLDEAAAGKPVELTEERIGRIEDFYGYSSDILTLTAELRRLRAENVQLKTDIAECKRVLKGYFHDW